MKLDSSISPTPAEHLPIEDPSIDALSFDEFEAATPEAWRAEAEAVLKGAPFEKKLVTRTREGIAIQPIYFAEDRSTTIRPGSFSQLIAQEIPATNPVEFNRMLLADLMAGQNTTPLVLDAAARESGNGRSGLAIRSLPDLRAALDGVDLAAAPIMTWAGPSALPFLGLLGAIAEERGIRPSGWEGAVLADPLTDWVRSGSLAIPLSEIFDEMALSVRWAIANVPRLRVVGVQASTWGDAGASTVDELAFAIATGVEYLREMVRSGIDPAEAADRFLFEFSLDSQIFMQIAKLRAARLLWTKVLEAFGADATTIALHGRSTTVTKSALDPHANLLRITAEAFAAMVGGVEAMHLAAFDDAIRIPDTFSRRLSRNVQIILAEECSLADVADPAGGSWFVESLTREVAEKAWARFQEIEAIGGMAAALRAGTPQQATAEQAGALLSSVAAGRNLLVGVNLSANPSEEPLVAERDGNAGSVTCEPDPATSDTAFEGRISDIPGAIEAFLSGWTIGQVRRALGRSPSDGTAIPRVQAIRASGGFEALRARARELSRTKSATPAAWLATFGPPRQHRARADFSSAFLACGGFDVRSGKSASTIDEAVADAVRAMLPVVVICSTDETYPEIVPASARALKRQLPGVRLLVAGAPGENEAAWREAGVDDFIHLRVNRLAFLENLLSTLSPSAQ